MFTVKYIASDGENGPIEAASVYSAHSINYEYSDGGASIKLLDDKGSVNQIIMIEDNTQSVVYVENAQGKTVQKFFPRHIINP